MSQCSQFHKELKNGVGKCSVPMWMQGVPAGFCGEPAYGKPLPAKWYQRRDGTRFRGDGGYEGYVPYLACVGHGGPKKEQALNLCDYCKNDFATCTSIPKFGCGKGNDNVYECNSYIERGNLC
jgi:hypothetical protein